MSQIQAGSAQTHPYHPPHVPKLETRVLRYLVPLIMVGLAVHLLLPQLAGLDKSLQVISHMSWWWLGGAFLMQMGSYAGSGLLLQGLSRLAGGQLSLMRSVIITLAAGSIGLIAAGVLGSSAALYKWLRAAGVNAQGAGLTATLKSVFNNGILLLLSLIGLSHLANWVWSSDSLGEGRFFARRGGYRGSDDDRHLHQLGHTHGGRDRRDPRPSTAFFLDSNLVWISAGNLSWAHNSRTVSDLRK